MNTEFNQVDLAEGSFTSNVFRFISDSQFSPYVAVVNNIQYDTVSQVLGWQSRFRWIMKPGNDLYIVYTQNWLDSPLEAAIHDARPEVRVEGALHPPLLT